MFPDPDARPASRAEHSIRLAVRVPDFSRVPRHQSALFWGQVACWGHWCQNIRRRIPLLAPVRRRCQPHDGRPGSVSDEPGTEALRDERRPERDFGLGVAASLAAHPAPDRFRGLQSTRHRTYNCRVVEPDASRVARALERAVNKLGSRGGAGTRRPRSTCPGRVGFGSGPVGVLTADFDDRVAEVDQLLGTTGAQSRILLYLRSRVGETVTKDELSGVAGIYEWARRRSGAPRGRRLADP